MAIRLRAKLETALSFIAIILGIVLIGATSERASEVKSRSLFLPPPPSVENLVGGYREVFADVFWLRLIQDADHCDKPVARGELCRTEKGWVYQMLDAITKLAPKFMAPYGHGATILSVLVGDQEGARLIFERGLNEFPNDWQLQYRAAYHTMEKLGDTKTAAELLLKAAKNGAPAWVYSLSAKLYTKEGQAVLAKSILEGVLAEGVSDSRWADRLRARLDEINLVLKSAPPSQQISE